MNPKPISPKRHGLIDYAFTAALLFMPGLLGFNKKAKSLYTGFGTGLLAYNALTDHPVSLKRVITYDGHYKLDCVNVATIALATGYKAVRKERKVFAFHVILLTFATLNVAFTDWEADTYAK